MEYLNLLYAVPVLVLLYWFLWRRQKKQLNDFAKPAMHKILFPMKSGVKPFVKFGLVIFAYVLLVFAIANPQIGSKIEEVKQILLEAEERDRKIREAKEKVQELLRG